MGAKSGIKGKGAERELCKFLMSVFGGSFIRADSSGAFVGGKNAFRKQILSNSQTRAKKSDIVPPDHMPKLVLESKFYKDFRFHQLMQPDDCVQLEEWIVQCLDAVDPGDLWFVCFKINLRGWYIVVPEEFISNFEYFNYCSYSGKNGNFRITELKTFVEKNKDAILKLAA